MIRHNIAFNIFKSDMYKIGLICIQLHHKFNRLLYCFKYKLI